MSSSVVSGTKSLMSGARFSVRFPRRMVAIWVSEPIGFEWPRRMLSTPAMKVVATAPSPGVRMPSFPFAGATPVFGAFDDPDNSFLLSAVHASRLGNGELIGTLHIQAKWLSV